MESPILVEYPKKGIVKITFNHPTALNAININLLRELVKALHTHQEAQVIVPDRRTHNFGRAGPAIYIRQRGRRFNSAVFSPSHGWRLHLENYGEVTPATTAAFVFTSGTTGKSKPCVLSHEYFILQARTLIDRCGLLQDDVLYTILLGATAAISAHFSASKFWDEIRNTKATVYDFLGATLALTYKQPPSPRDRDHKVRLAWGVPIPHFAKDYEQRFGHPLITLYGSVEASLPIFQQGDLPPGSCGRLRHAHQLRSANDMDEEVPPNTVGHLLLRSDIPNSFFQGYFNDPVNTASAFSGLWLHTGDLAKVDDDGNVYFMGRVKDVIRRRGENVNASEVEKEFLQHPDVLIAAAFGIPSQLGLGTEGDIKVAVQIRNDSTLDERTLWHWAVKNMARYQVPSVIEFVGEIQKTPTGKIEKHGLVFEGGRSFDIRQA